MVQKVPETTRKTAPKVAKRVTNRQKGLKKWAQKLGGHVEMAQKPGRHVQYC